MLFFLSTKIETFQISHLSTEIVNEYFLYFQNKLVKNGFWGYLDLLFSHSRDQLHLLLPELTTSKRKVFRRRWVGIVGTPTILGTLGVIFWEPKLSKCFVSSP